MWAEEQVVNRHFKWERKGRRSKAAPNALKSTLGNKIVGVLKGTTLQVVSKRLGVVPKWKDTKTPAKLEDRAATQARTWLPAQKKPTSDAHITSLAKD